MGEKIRSPDSTRPSMRKKHASAVAAKNTRICPEGIGVHKRRLVLQTETGQVLRGLRADGRRLCRPGVQDLVRRHHKIINDVLYVLNASTAVSRTRM